MTTFEAGQDANAESAESLFVEAKEVAKAEDWEDCSQMFSRALEMKIEEIGKEKDESLIDFYFEYGKSLLRLTQQHNDVFGQAIRDTQKTAKEAHEKKQKEESEVNANSNDKTKENTENTEVNSNSKAEKEEKTDENNEDNNNGNENEEDVDGDEEGGQEDGDAGYVEDYDTTEDRQIAWECLETARVIAEECLQMIAKNKNNSNSNDNNKDNKEREINLKLANVLSVEGELQLEDEMCDESLANFEKSIEIREKYNDDFREISFCHFSASLAAENQFTANCHMLKALFLFRNQGLKLLLENGKDLTKEYPIANATLLENELTQGNTNNSNSNATDKSKQEKEECEEKENDLKNTLLDERIKKEIKITKKFVTDMDFFMNEFKNNDNMTEVYKLLKEVKELTEDIIDKMEEEPDEGKGMLQEMSLADMLKNIEIPAEISNLYGDENNNNNDTLENNNNNCNNKKQQNEQPAFGVTVTGFGSSNNENNDTSNICDLTNTVKRKGSLKRKAGDAGIVDATTGDDADAPKAKKAKVDETMSTKAIENNNDKTEKNNTKLNTETEVTTNGTNEAGAAAPTDAAVVTQNENKISETQTNGTVPAN